MIWRILVGVLTVLYPFAIYFGLQHFDPRFLILLLIFFVAVRLFTDKQGPLMQWGAVALLAVLVAWTWVGNTSMGLKVYPVLVNLSLLATFAWSLKSPQSMIERLATMGGQQFSDYARNYMRKVTVVWCVFFFCNGSIALYTAVAASDKTWALYNGLISYFLLGAMFAIEWVVRQFVMKYDNE
ncbi:hypothetical protein NBRC116494_05190 [Aurantivibrio plasticivorans]